ncbi:MAG: hypothetical protein IJ143_00380 [Neisseriaceae bacterium]|nr:hypothetical protein [Neisseriaceae bacterium]
MTNSTTNIAKLSLQGNYAETVLSYYLWGQANAPKPNEIVDEKYANRSENILMETTNKYAEQTLESVGYLLQIDAQEYMDTVGGFRASEMGVFQKFFNNVTEWKEKDKTTGKEKSVPFGIKDIQKAGGVISPDGKIY